MLYLLPRNTRIESWKRGKDRITQWGGDYRGMSSGIWGIRAREGEVVGWEGIEVAGKESVIRSLLEESLI